MRKSATITAMKDTAFRAYTQPTPSEAITMPASAGPIIDAA